MTYFFTFGGFFIDFNSHAHVERDAPQAPVEQVSPISTHTLTWSVTMRNGKKQFIIDISTHTLTWSVTVVYPLLWVVMHISTHTLTWSVTERYYTST